MEALLERAGVLWLSRGQAELGQRALERALKHDPDRPGVAQLLSHQLEESAQYRRLADVLRSTAERTRQPELRCTLWLRMSVVQEEHLDNRPGAIAAAKQALDSDPTNRDAILRLAELRRQNRQWDEAVKLLKQAVTTPRREKEEGIDLTRLRAYMDLAEVYHQHRNDTGRAISYLQAADAIDDQQVEVLERLTRLHVERGEFEPAETYALRWIDEAESDDQRAGAFVQLAHARADRDLQAATEALVSGVRLSGERGPAGPPFRRHIKEHPDTTRQYVRALRAYIAAGPKGSRVSSWLEIARVHRGWKGTLKPPPSVWPRGSRPTTTPTYDWRSVSSSFQQARTTRRWITPERSSSANRPTPMGYGSIAMRCGQWTIFPAPRGPPRC